MRGGGEGRAPVWTAADKSGHSPVFDELQLARPPEQAKRELLPPSSLVKCGGGGEGGDEGGDWVRMDLGQAHTLVPAEGAHSHRFVAHHRVVHREDAVASVQLCEPKQKSKEGDWGGVVIGGW